MTILHIITNSEVFDNQVTEIKGNSRQACIDTYLNRNAWNKNEREGMEILPGNKVLVKYKEETCLLTAINPYVLSAIWTWK